RIAPETLRRIACDSVISTAAVDAESCVLDLGRATRTFTPAQAAAIMVRYPTCIGLGCRIPSADCEMHHVDWWGDDGPTALANGVPACWHEHHLLHELGWRIEVDATTGVVRWYRPDGSFAGEVHPRRPPPPIPIATRDPVRALTLARIAE